MPTTTSKLKLPVPVAADAHAVHTDLLTLANALDVRIAHRGLPYFGKNYVESGGTLSAPGGLFAAVTAGTACINGQTFDFTAPANLALTNTATNRIWLTMTKDANGYYTGHTWSVRTDAVVPADSVMLGEQVTAGGAVTATWQTYRGVIQPGRLISRLATSSPSTAYGSPALMTGAGTMDVVHDGQTPIALEADIPRVYAGSAFDWGVSLRNVTDSMTHGTARHYFTGATQLDTVPLRVDAAEIGTLIGRKNWGFYSNASGAVGVTVEHMVMRARFDF